MTEHVDEHFETVRVRRSPKYAVFLALGAVLGVVVAMILTFAFHGTDQASAAGYTYSQGQVFGFLAVVCIAVGLVVGGTVALILDRIVGRRIREVAVDRETVRLDD